MGFISYNFFPWGRNFFRNFSFEFISYNFLAADSGIELFFELEKIFLEILGNKN